MQLDSRQASKLIIKEVEPKYPALAEINYIWGPVRLLVSVNRQGQVRRIHVLRGQPFLAMACVRAIRQWKYRPLVTKTGPAGFQTIVNFNFALVNPSGLSLGSFPPHPDQFVARAVHPPKIMFSPGGHREGIILRLRVLVDKEGKVVDSTLISGSRDLLEAAQEIIATWKFRPAQWGTLHVPWYAVVNVPVRIGQQVRTGSQPAGRSNDPPNK